jgi:hypothetical protein
LVLFIMGRLKMAVGALFGIFIYFMILPIFFIFGD